jgi:hypothetical protein
MNISSLHQHILDVVQEVVQACFEINAPGLSATLLLL